MLMPGDEAAVAGRRAGPQPGAPRVGRWPAPTGACSSGFLVTIIVAAVLGLVPPLLIRRIVDDALDPASPDRTLVTLLALLMVGVAVARRRAVAWSSGGRARAIGEGLIFDLRVRLFDHVQRMPIAFFTRTQTGALVSRMNNDVIGAQRALTGTLGSVVVERHHARRRPLIAMARPRVAPHAPRRRARRRCSCCRPAGSAGGCRRITREGMDLNASMNTTMTERFGVAGALLVKLFGRYERRGRRASPTAPAGVRDIGVRSAMYSRAFFVGMSLRRRGRRRPRLRRRRPPRARRRHHPRHARSPSAPTSCASTDRSRAWPTPGSTS